MKLILASNSPRRRELLTNAGINFEAVVSGIDEGCPAGDELPEVYARRLAQAKALHVAASASAGSIVLGADTVVVIANQVLGKPASPLDATRMLRMLSGETHEVITAISLVRAPRQVEAADEERTFVTFRELSTEEIRDYVASGEPFDKAGGYAIQGLASKFIVHVSGCYFNVVGLPIALLYESLRKLPEWKSPSEPGNET